MKVELYREEKLKLVEMFVPGSNPRESMGFVLAIDASRRGEPAEEGMEFIRHMTPGIRSMPPLTGYMDNSVWEAQPVPRDRAQEILDSLEIAYTDEPKGLVVTEEWTTAIKAGTPVKDIALLAEL